MVAETNGRALVEAIRSIPGRVHVCLELRTGALRTRVYKARVHMAGLRNAARAYSMAVQDTVRVKNRVKAGFEVESVPSVAGQGRIRPQGVADLMHCDPVRGDRSIGQ